jgi:hypothetical protein
MGHDPKLAKGFGMPPPMGAPMGGMGQPPMGRMGQPPMGGMGQPPMGGMGMPPMNAPPQGMMTPGYGMPQMQQPGFGRGGMPQQHMMQQQPRVIQQPAPQAQPKAPVKTGPKFIEKMHLPSGGTRDDANKLIQTMLKYGWMIDGAALSYYVKKLAFEDAAIYLLHKIHKFVVSLTPEEFFKTIKNLVHVKCQVKAG